MARGDRVRELKDKLAVARSRQRHQEAAELLVELCRHEPNDPQWPHRCGTELQLLGKKREAIAAWERAVDLYAKAGFLARAIAMAKTILYEDPKRTDVLARVEPLELPPMSRRFSNWIPPMPARVPAAQPDVPVALASRPAAVVAATPLVQAPDSSPDEVRFEDAPESLQIVLSPVEVGAQALPRPGLPDEPDAEGEDAGPDAQHVAMLPAFPLFAEIEREALDELALGSKLFRSEIDGEHILRRGDPADSLFAIIEGAVIVRPPAGARPSPPVLLGEGEVLGESCLLEGAVRTADVFVQKRLMALHIPREVLADIAATHPKVGDVLFDLLSRRLVGALMSTSPLFAAFDPQTRLEIARLFEVRRAPSGTHLLESGKRSDGLYIVLAGRIAIDDGFGKTVEAGPGAVFGQRSLLFHTASDMGVSACRELVVLRLAAARFHLIAAQYPTVLAHLSDLASQPMEAIGRGSLS